MNFILRLKNDALLTFDAAHYDLGKAYIGEFKLAFIAALLKADVEDVDATTKGSDSNLGAVMLPGH